jgi:hypothetical protein
MSALDELFTTPQHCDEYEARIGSLFGDVAQFKRSLVDLRGLTTDAQGRTVILGLDAAETEEMILLKATDSNGARYRVLREKHDAARQADAMKNIAQYLEKHIPAKPATLRQRLRDWCVMNVRRLLRSRRKVES